MTRSNFLTGAVTVILLSLIVVLVSWNSENGTATAVAQNQKINSTHTASLQRFTLPEMVNKSDRIFRGTVIDFEPGTVDAGGGTLPTVTYRMRVEESFKGSFAEKDGVRYAEITMLGNVKEAGAQGDLQKMSVLPTPPQLSVGSDYLLMMTPESSIGLSAPIGLGQGSFKIYSQDKEEWAKNEFNNAGLFDGAVTYDSLAEQIQQGGE